MQLKPAEETVRTQGGAAQNAVLLLAASFALPGLAVAETAPDQAQLSLKFMRYEDSQPGLERVRVSAPSLALRLPVAGQWSFDGSLTTDDVSGATPKYHTAISGASRMQDYRKAGDLRVTRYLHDGSVSAGIAYSTEHDYVSRALSLQASLESADKNTTWTFGLGAARDTINPVNLLVENEKRRSTEFLLGLTQVITQNDIALLNFTHVRGRGYFSDPYKYVDERPRARDQNILTARWNHHFATTEGTLRSSYRFYRDSFAIRAHTLTLELEQPLGQGWTLTPSVRSYRQGAASFYFPPVYDKLFGPPFPPGYDFLAGRFSSADQRLSAFKAESAGLKIAKDLTPDWTIDAKVERYRQHGASGLAPLTASIVQLGLSTRW